MSILCGQKTVRHGNKWHAKYSKLLFKLVRVKTSR